MRGGYPEVCRLNIESSFPGGPFMLDPVTLTALSEKLKVQA